jgi:hypothetical protein
VMAKGRIVTEFDPRTCTRDEIMAASGEAEVHTDGQVQRDLRPHAPTDQAEAGGDPDGRTGHDSNGAPR